mgnify:CR=1 FL=1
MLQKHEVKLDEVIEILKGIQNRDPSFYGETTQFWQNGKGVLLREVMTMKKEVTNGKDSNLRVAFCGQR